MVYLYTGEIQTGKSTSLYNLIQTHPGKAGGFVTPTLQDEKKYIVNSETMEIFPFELDPGTNTNGLSVGRYLLCEKAFIAAIAWTKNHLLSTNIFIIDELGKLELTDKGFHELFSAMLHSQKSDHTIIAVVRKSLLTAITEKYSLENAVILEHPFDMNHFFQ
jgi:nucleoside-triphosphatase THEP1